MASNCTLPPLVPETLAPYVMGYQFNWALFGVLTTQVYIYQTSSFQDGWALHLVVWFSYLLECFQIAMATHDSYEQLAVSWGQPALLHNGWFVWLTMPICTAITSLIAQCFYAWRIYILSDSSILTGAIVLLSFMQSGAGLASGIESALLDGKDTSNITTNTSTVVTVWLTGTAACDILIFTAMAYCLSRSRTGFKGTDKLLNKIILLVIETGLATAVVAVIELALFVGIPDRHYYVVPALMLSKLYTNSLLVILNNRPRRKCADCSNVHSSQFSPGTFSPGAFGVRSTMMDAMGSIQVSVDRETYGDQLAMISLNGKEDTHTRDKMSTRAST